MQLGLLLTYRCNARCAHCCVNSGPDRSEVMDEADVYSYIDQAADIPYDASNLSFSGGEVFLYYDLLMRAIGHAADKFRSISVVTNAFWATNEEKALQRLAPLRDAGLTMLGVSTSPFHTQFVNPVRIRYALAAAERLGLETLVKVTTPSNGPSARELLQVIEPLPKGTVVDEMSLLPGGRASFLPPGSFSETPGIPEGRCPGAMLNIHPNGDAYFCCTPDAFINPLKLGNAKTTPVRDLVRTYYFRGLLNVLREQGPAGFVPAVRCAGLEGKLRKGYVDVCHLCTSLLWDPDTLRVVQSVGEQREVEIFSRILSQTFGRVGVLVETGGEQLS